jgi:hypothetical protein
VRKRGTALLVAGVVGLAVAAGVDALRSGDDPAGGSATSTSADRTNAGSAAQKLASRQITGVLYFTVRVRPGQCALRSLALPSLEATSAVDVGSCRIATSPGGRVATGDPCPGSSISVLGTTQSVSFEGCAPAWKPDGTLTFVRQGRVIEVVSGCLEPAPADCRRRTPVENRHGQEIRELAWLDADRLAVLTAGRGGLALVSVYEVGRRLAGPTLSRSGLAYLRPFGPRRAVVRSGRPPEGAIFFSIDERRVAFENDLPGFLVDGQALAVSPDGAWVASTRAGVVHIYRLGDRRPVDPVRLAIDAVDLGWGTA